MGKTIIAVIGAGGKTTALSVLARGSGKGSVFLTTTTHMFPMRAPDCRLCLQDPGGEELAEALSQGGILCAGAAARMGKLGILPGDVLESGIQAAEVTIYEGDGAHCLPLKLHKPYEPVILPKTSRGLILAGLSALGKPVGEVIHRHELEPAWQGHPQTTVGVPELVRCILETARASGLPWDTLRVFLNQADVLETPAPAEEAAAILCAQGLDTRFGSLQNPPEDLYFWVTG